MVFVFISRGFYFLDTTLLRFFDKCHMGSQKTGHEKEENVTEMATMNLLFGSIRRPFIFW